MLTRRNLSTEAVSVLCPQSSVLSRESSCVARQPGRHRAVALAPPEEKEPGGRHSRERVGEDVADLSVRPQDLRRVVDRLRGGEHPGLRELVDAVQQKLD